MLAFADNRRRRIDLPMEADRRLLGRVEVLSCGEKVKNKKGAHKPKYDALRVTTTGCETLDGRKDVNAYKRKSPKGSGDVVGDERHRRALSLLCTAVGEGFGGLVEPGFGGDNVTWRGVGGENSLSLAVGMRLSIGGVRCVVTQFNEPCSNLKDLWRRLAAAEARWPGWPRETTRLTHGITACNGPLGQNTGPGQRGWFARVVQEGEIRVGDEIFAEAPDGPPAKKQRKISSFFSSESSKL